MTAIDLSGRSADPLAELTASWIAGELEREGSIDASSASDIDQHRVRWRGARIGREISIPLTPSARVFGSGESFTALDLRGRRRVLVNREMHGATGVDVAYLNVPFFWSDDGWGLLVETGAPVLADVGAGDPAVARFLVLDDDARVVTLAGTPAELLAAYAERTGRSGDWPDWAFGTWMSRATYLDAAEMHAVLDALQGAGCPADVMHVDAWMEGNVFREFTTSWRVDRRRFPTGWTDALRARGTRVSLWLNPFVLAGSPLGRELRDAGLLLRDSSGGPAATPDRANRWIVDFTNPRAVAWWGERVRRLLDEERPDALKLDFGEEIPLDAVAHDGRRGLAIRNAYALLYQRATAEAIPVDRRPFPFFCRSGTTGAQAYPCHWVGDTPATWRAMAGALDACLSLSLSGFALVAHDAGGFSTPGLGLGRIPAELLDGGDARFGADVEPELYGRWAQWAAFAPVTRFHGLGLREPTAYPEPWRSAAIAALRVRRELLLPHLRRALDEARRTGLPLMRPTPLTHPRDPGARQALRQYTLGADILVAPVLEPGGRVALWMPPGDWTPILGAPVLAPGSHVIAVAPDEYPVWLRRA